MKNTMEEKFSAFIKSHEIKIKSNHNECQFDRESPLIYIIKDNEIKQIRDITNAVKLSNDFIFFMIKWSYKNSSHTNHRSKYFILDTDLNQTTYEYMGWKLSYVDNSQDYYHKEDKMNFKISDPQGVTKKKSFTSVSQRTLLEAINYLKEVAHFGSIDAVTEMELNKTKLFETQKKLKGVYLAYLGYKSIHTTDLNFIQEISFYEKNFPRVNKDSVNIILANFYFKNERPEEAFATLSKIRHPKFTQEGWEEQLQEKFENLISEDFYVKQLNI